VVRFSYVGCYVDFTGGVRDLNELSGVTRIGEYEIISSRCVSNTDMSHELCSSVCSLGGFAYFGVQSGKACLCGSSFGSQGKANESDCSTKCRGNSSQICGAPWRNSVFALTYPNQNFYKMLKHSNFTVETSKTSSWPAAAPSVMDCLARCSAKADCQAAVFSQRLLACHLLAFAYPPASLTGPDWTLYQPIRHHGGVSPELVFLFALLTSAACKLLNHSYLGCYVDNTNGSRDMTGLSGLKQLGKFHVQPAAPLVNSDEMTIELCSSVCSLGRFSHFGVQSETQCFCGNSFGSQGVAAKDDDCNKNCRGNPLQRCGGINRNSVYSLNYSN
uniref:WSC domain-containing protein n=1 Tax=Macrostomum lignano TaxID=282301 RepID=A0A1I8JK67_9PLAT